ncbi:MULTISPECIES: alpha/beta hydrolase [Halobacteriovorax]|uniref:Esterase n=1 Tax=Halobacteriovorax vibrionivorans TaxID=2152716 RepID=A0ABY0IKL3_9BACT|nr:MULTISPECIES: esterase [Halobacteriovorax]AYF45312.1 serine hydrolase [Halobacteriovorax sp. BALOs_7]RZF22396.1 esterase [Halobacteriovorax vibrionivorans]TGD47587.1 esterase [Halobacteriovorax sp. Y22]
MRVTRINDFDILLHEGSTKKSVVVLHGYGASFQDLAPLYQYLDPKEELNWYFVDGPLKVDIGMGMKGSAWFPIDMMGLQQAMMAQRVEDFFSQVVPDGIEDMRDRLIHLIKEIKKNSEELYLGGFSQGSMMSLAIAYKEPALVDRLFLLSSTLFDETHIAENTKHIRHIPIFQSHGTGDPVLPYFLSEKLKTYLEKVDQYEFHHFEGGHEIPMPILNKLQRFLEEGRE